MSSILFNTRGWGFFMVVYVEYAFAWNFLLDATLSWLSLRACKRKIIWWRLTLSAFLGGAFALLFPLLTLPNFLTGVLKFAVGFLLCFIAFGRVKTKKEWGRYALNCIFFFSFAFAFGGAILAISGENTHKGIILVIFAVLTVISLVLIARLYARSAVTGRIYACKIAYKAKTALVDGFYDSGNLAMQNGLPVCFLSPDTFYDLWGEELALGIEKERGQVCVEVAFDTLGGEKRTKGYLGNLELALQTGEKTQKQVYFVPSANMLRREYKLLLNARIFE